MSNRYGLILAGGRGTRFWPRSRRANAKQVLKFFGDRSLIQQTVDRLRPVLPPERSWILTNDHLRAEIVKQLPEVPKKQILAEPAQRNTNPCIGLAAHILSELDPDAVHLPGVWVHRVVALSAADAARKPIEKRTVREE